MAIDWFDVQEMVLDALQEIRIKRRWKSLDTENNVIESARNKTVKYTSELLPNEDTLKQLLARVNIFCINIAVNGLIINAKELSCFLNAIPIWKKPIN